jgi:DNA-binding beta-propeller fold protein YncE
LLGYGHRDCAMTIPRVTAKITVRCVAGALVVAAPLAVHAEVMVVGIDRKFAYDKAAVRQALPPGHDEVMFFDLKTPLNPHLLGTLPLENSIVGPPTNVAVTPDQSLALIADSVHSQQTDTGWKAAPADELFVVDLAAKPPSLRQTVRVGRQPSGIAISADGRFALVANRDDESITVLQIKAGNVSVSDTIPTGQTVGSVAIAPDGRLAVATETSAHKVLLLAISESQKVTVVRDLWVGLFPWNVAITPDGHTALVNNIGNAGQSDGSMKSVSVLDLSTDTAHVEQYLTVGDAPEGLAISPSGDFAALTILRGSYDAPSSAWFRHDVGQVTLVSLKHGEVRVRNSVDVGAFPEGVAFDHTGKYIYAGNYRSNSISILTIDRSGHLVDTHNTIQLPGPPASLRVGPR